MKILIVEDEAPIREVIRKYLEINGFRVTEAASGEVALLKFDNSFDLVVLDLNLPHQDGLTVCQAIRKKSKVPIMIVTARTEEIDELKGLSLGADDYLKKPFSPKVLVARIQSLLRRTKNGSARNEKNGDLSIDERKMTVFNRGQEIHLTATQFRILNALAKEPGKVFSRQELLATSGEEKRIKQAMERTIDAHIKAIRKLIGDDPQNPQYIKTVIGNGYKYKDEYT